MMLHYVKLESEEIARHNEMLAEWIPRIVYAGIAAWIAYGILSAGAPMCQRIFDILSQDTCPNKALLDFFAFGV